jgi:hypothetical protein
MDSGPSGGSSESGSGTGKGGSMARICIVDNNLFTVDQTNLKMFDISDPAKPILLDGRTKKFNAVIETIFPMDTLLFIGSQTGMYIYYVSKYRFPEYLSTATHVSSCDPVVAQENYAYVTLNSNNTGCGRNTDELQIYDITDLTRPQLLKVVPDFISPMGLGVDGDRLFICDEGLKMYNITNRINPIQISDLHDAGVHDAHGAYDVIPIPSRKSLILVASSGIYQLDYTGESLKLLSKIEINKINAE